MITTNIYLHKDPSAYQAFFVQYAYNGNKTPQVVGRGVIDDGKKYEMVMVKIGMNNTPRKSKTTVAFSFPFRCLDSFPCTEEEGAKTGAGFRQGENKPDL